MLHLNYTICFFLYAVSGNTGLPHDDLLRVVDLSARTEIDQELRVSPDTLISKAKIAVRDALRPGAPEQTVYRAIVLGIASSLIDQRVPDLERVGWAYAKFNERRTYEFTKGSVLLFDYGSASINFRSEYAKLLAKARQLHKQDPGDDLVTIALARLAFASGNRKEDLDLSLQLSSAMLKKHPNFTPYWFWTALMNRTAGQLRPADKRRYLLEARKDFTVFLSHWSGDPKFSDQARSEIRGIDKALSSR